MMEHKDALEVILSDPEVRKEYDALETEYSIKSTIIRLRIEKGFTQADLAKLIGTKQSSIARLENGTYNPSIKMLTKIAQATGKNLRIQFAEPNQQH